ncbi:MAG: FHA domain-containing protein [Oscillospiraceae bacterium]
MSESFIENLKEHLKNVNLENIKEFLIEFGNKLHSSNNLACLITLICIDIFVVIFLLKVNKEKRLVSMQRLQTVTPYGLAIGDRYFLFKSDEILIGRHPSCDIKCLNLTVSRYHAIITLRNGIWCIEDMGSTHGTFLNGQPVEHITPIQEGDDIRFGEQHFTVEHSVHRLQNSQEGE